METFYIILIALLFCLVGYLMGSFLSGDFFIKIFKRKNIRNYGSGNVGATNVRRTFGRKFGFIVALLDAVKGYLAVMICFFIWQAFSKSPAETDKSLDFSLGFLIYFAGLFAVIGHCFPFPYVISVFMHGFESEITKNKMGGKGVSTAGGVLFSISPWLGLPCLIIWLVVMYSSKYVFLASITTLLVSPILALIPQMLWLYMFTPQLTLSSALTYNLNLLDILMIALVCLLNALVVLYRHKENIQRFKNKNERKINDAKNV